MTLTFIYFCFPSRAMLFPNQKNKHFPVYKPLSGSTNFILLTSLLHFPRFMEQAAKSRRGVTLTLEHEHRTRMDLALRGGVNLKLMGHKAHPETVRSRTRCPANARPPLRLHTARDGALLGVRRGGLSRGPLQPSLPRLGTFHLNWSRHG